MEKINWGVLGTAGIAYGQTIPGMQQAENCNLYAIAGRKIEKAKKFQEKFGFEKAYGSYEELLADPSVEAVYLPLPNHVHLEWIKKAAQAGKHILCEKPLGLDAKQVEEAFEVCRENGVILMEAFAYLHNDAINAMADEIKAGAVGNVSLIEACFFTGPPADGDIRWYRSKGGGAVYDLGCYSISLAQRIMDEMPEHVEAIAHFTDGTETGKGGQAGNAQSENSGVQNGNERVDDFAQIYFRYKGGAMAAIGCGFTANGRSDRMVIHGDKGSLWADIVYNQEGKNVFEVRNGDGVKTFEMDVRSNYALEVEQLGNCIRGGEKPRISEDFSVNVAATIDRVLEYIGY